jgi:hypothetical protein
VGNRAGPFFFGGNIMEMKLTRSTLTRQSTIGMLFLDGSTVPECYTLEDVVRAPGTKVPGRTAIPAGTYQVTIDNSVRFRRPMPHVLDVPYFTGVRIHSGNTAADTEGCILVGRRPAADAVLDSRSAFLQLFTKLERAIAGGQTVTLTIS